MADSNPRRISAFVIFLLLPMISPLLLAVMSVKPFACVIFVQ
jgi:hypothetical protein